MADKHTCTKCGAELEVFHWCPSCDEERKLASLESAPGAPSGAAPDAPEEGAAPVEGVSHDLVGRLCTFGGNAAHPRRVRNTCLKAAEHIGHLSRENARLDAELLQAGTDMENDFYQMESLRAEVASLQAELAASSRRTEEDAKPV